MFAVQFEQILHENHCTWPNACSKKNPYSYRQFEEIKPFDWQKPTALLKFILKLSVFFFQMNLNINFIS